MSVDGIAAIIVILCLCILLFLKWSKIEVQRALFPVIYVVMYSSTIGLGVMKRLAFRFPRVLNVLGVLGIVVGFLGMVFIVGQLAYGSVLLFTSPDAQSGVQPVLPFEAKGVFFVPFLYWVLSIFLIAVVHEGAHGVVSFLHKIPVKRSGFAFLCIFLPVIPAAFVEPDEKVLRKARAKQQLAVYAAGPFSNVLFAFLSVSLFAALSPVLSSAFVTQGVVLSSVDAEGPAFAAGLREGMVVETLGGVPIISLANVSSVLGNASPGDSLVVATKDHTFEVIAGASQKNADRAFLGVQVKPNVVLNGEFTEQYGVFLPKFAKWLAGLFFWLFLLNIGIGLFNLLPIGPLDGGRMFELVAVRWFGKEQGLKVWSLVSVALTGMILLNIVAGFIR